MKRALAQFGKRQQGTAIVEFALLMPWLVFVFIGTFNLGLYMYILITAENAARIAALQASMTKASAVNSTAACKVVLKEMSSLPNVRNESACGLGVVTTAIPVSVVATLNTYSSSDLAAQITVKYLTANNIAIWGLPNQITINKTAIAPLLGN